MFNSWDRAMRYILILFFFTVNALTCFSQSMPIDGFLDGKSVVLISAAPNAKPLMNWKDLAEEIHPALVEAGGDPVAYYELEEVILSEASQAGFAAAFMQRLIKNIVVVTRKQNSELVLNIMPFTGDKNMVAAGTSWTTAANSLEVFKEQIAAIGTNRKSNNLLVIDVPEFISESPTGQSAGGPGIFLHRNPLNLDVFKLGVPLSGATGESGFLTTFRYDLLGKSPEKVMAEQQQERAGLESIFKAHYPHEVEFLTTTRTDEALIKDRVQFLLMRIEGREGDIMKSMGVEIPDTIQTDRLVLKYYIKFLVRNEFYIGPVWDADPNWETALTNFLNNLR